MRVQLLHVQDCPGLTLTHDRLRAALDAVGAGLAGAPTLDQLVSALG